MKTASCAEICKTMILFLVLTVGALYAPRAMAQALPGKIAPPTAVAIRALEGNLERKYSSSLGFATSRKTLYMDDNYEIPWYVRWIDGCGEPTLYSSNNDLLEVYEDEGIWYAYADHPGTANIWIRYAGRKAVMRVTVKYRPIEDFYLDPEFTTLAIGQSACINAVVYPYGTSHKVSWKSSKSFAKVDKNGNVTGVKAGSVTITATAANGWQRSYSFEVYDPVVRRALVIVEGSATNGSYTDASVAAGEQAAFEESYHGMMDALAYNNIDVSGVWDPWSWAEVQSEILSTFSEADADDISYIYILAHGGYNAGNGTYWVCLGNGNSGNYAVTAAVLRQMLDQIPGRKVLFMDSCHSGALIGKGSGAQAPAGTAQGFVQAFMSTGGGRLTPKTSEMIGSDYYLLCSAAMDNVSYTFWNWRNFMGEPMFTGSTFAYSICRGSGWNMCRDRKTSYYADYNKNNKITLDELSRYTAEMMKKIYKKTKVSVPATMCVYPSNSPFVLFTK